jgi:hypothetical protein
MEPMQAVNEIAKRHFQAMLSEAEQHGVATDILGRALLDHVIQLWLKDRSHDDVASELKFTADSLDPDTDFEFMRP